MSWYEVAGVGPQKETEWNGHPETIHVAASSENCRCGIDARKD